MNKVRTGDGSHLRRFRPWQLFSRSLFYIRLADDTGHSHVYAVDVRLLTDSKSKADHEAGKGKPPASLYRDGLQIARSNVPTMFTVPGGVIHVATTEFGVRRMHYVTDDGTEQLLQPDRRSQEGRRARLGEMFPTVSRLLALLSVVVLLVALSLSALQGVEVLTEIPPVAERVGTFRSPMRLSAWANTAVVIAGLLAGYERATRVRHHWLLDTAAS
nr:hypothetical protein [Nesterenkonia xinjiangensis]